MTLEVIKKGVNITKISDTVNKIFMTPRGEFHLIYIVREEKEDRDGACTCHAKYIIIVIARERASERESLALNWRDLIALCSALPWQREREGENFAQ